MQTPEKQEFLQRHKLPKAYLEEASIWFEPIIEQLVAHHKDANKTLILGINGCQGSGKTTLADYLLTSFSAHNLRCVSLSIDDFYFSSHERQQLSKEIHPLLATRGVPGTHDLGLAFDTLDKLTNAQGTVQIPRFDKASDNRKEKGEWSQIETPVDIIILEGWCVGIPAQSEIDLERAINSLEQDYDEDGKWRKYVNDQLLGAYASLWQQIDQLIMLKAPDFSCVFEWRLEQEEKLKRSTESTLLSENKIMAPEEIKHFIQHYERLTRHALEHLPEHCHHVFELDSKRVIQSYLNADTGDCI